MGSWAAACQLGHEGRHENHQKCQDATTTTTTVWYLFSYKKHTKVSKGRERERKKAPTPNIVLSSCANGMGQKLRQRKVCNGRFFLFTMDVVHLCSLPQKRKISTTLDLFIYLFIKFCNGYYPFMPQKRGKKREKKVHTWQERKIGLERKSPCRLMKLKSKPEGNCCQFQSSQYPQSCCHKTMWGSWRRR